MSTNVNSKTQIVEKKKKKIKNHLGFSEMTTFKTCYENMVMMGGQL